MRLHESKTPQIIDLRGFFIDRLFREIADTMADDFPAQDHRIGLM